ncbi:unnamed protein product [Rotaria socialis]|uniref:Uncharacterized protein n=1 Tax=Rotaria socialis TaxID=392032 RepID=A0A817XWR3_9BILA|nr:unnamed protein product [Rotaria socialis]CAF3308158.1 unnamed protein product [Rotaria socialis]CAF3373145.1 unnamed protein product [Rotaria socialis]CAF3477273.1 unnamed protein product [Rotaria socialis]CAF3596022.1 unnamed protein product [Rotaria socialis]
MNQLETNLFFWAVFSIILFELLCIIFLCRWCCNRIKPKRFYVKREEYEYLQGNNGTPSQFQSTILRPPHADELALVGTIRGQNPTISFDSGIQNFGFYRDGGGDDDDDDDDDGNEFNPPVSSVIASPPSSSQHLNWIELQAPQSTGIINTAQLLPADYEIRSYPTDDYIYTHQSPPPHPTILDLRHYRHEYEDHDNFKHDDENEFENFQFQSLRRSDLILPHTQRTDTSTESFGGNNLTIVPKSILKSSNSTPPPPPSPSPSPSPPLDLLSIQYSQTHRSRTPSKFDESPRISVKINTDESIPIDYPTSAIEIIIPNESTISRSDPTSSSSSRMRFASVSQLNEVEWEVPREFQTVVYDSINDRQASRTPLIYSSNENLNNNNNNNNEKLSNRQRSQSASVDQRRHVSCAFVPWDRDKNIVQPFYLSDNIEQADTTQQKAFEY